MQEAEEWVSLNEAASQLGVSVQTIRRRIKDDQIAARKVASPYGPAWEVSISKMNRVVNSPEQELEREVNIENADDGESSTVESGLSSPGMVEALQLIQQLQQEVVAKAEAASLWQGRAEVLSIQLSQVQETVKALEAPRTEPQEEIRPWWKFW